MRLRKSLADLWTAYHASPEFIRLKPRTKKDYEQVREWIGAGAHAALMSALRSEDILKLRDKAYRGKGLRFANYVVQVLRLVLEWGRPRGWLKGNAEGNPARGVKLIERPKGQRNQNRAWTDAEVRNFLNHAPDHLKLPFALGVFAGMREGDMIDLTWRAYDGSSVRWIASKNDEPCMAPATGLLKSLLDGAEKTALKVCTNTTGKPWKTGNSFRSAFFKMVRKLQAKGLLDEGATFHGLRHTVGVSARGEGESEFRVAAALGDRSTAMAELDGRDADRHSAQSAVLRGVQERFANGSLETNLETKEE